MMKYRKQQRACFIFKRLKHPPCDRCRHIDCFCCNRISLLFSKKKMFPPNCNAMQDFDLLVHFPYMFCNETRTKYKGFINTVHKSYAIQLEDFDGFIKIQYTKALEPFREELEEVLKQRQIVLFALERIRCVLSKSVTEIPANTAEIDRIILREYVELREFHINIHKATLSGDLKCITVSSFDVKNRLHEIVIQTTPRRDRLFQVINCNLPEFSCCYDADNSLIALYNRFLAKIENPKMQIFFNLIEEIDQNCWVLDPEIGDRKQTYRRIVLDENVSLIVTFTSVNIQDFPNMKFFGPNKYVSIYEERVNKNYKKWDPNSGFLEQLLEILELPFFPPKNEQTIEDNLLVNLGECCICFSLRLQDLLPDVICSNTSCRQFFHRKCLFQWLISMNVMTDNEEIVGKCPNCEKPIFCPILG